MSIGKYPLWSVEDRKKDLWVKFYEYSESYKRIVLVLLKNEKKEIEEKRFDLLEDILPVLHNFSHYLELLLKCFLLRSNESLNSIKTHNLEELYRKLKIKNADLSISSNVEQFIIGLHKLIEDEQSLRYPIDSKGKKRYFTSDNDIVRDFDLEGIDKMIKRTIGEFALYSRKLYN